MKDKLQEKTRAAAAPRKPKKGAVSSPLKVDDIFSGFNGEDEEGLRLDQISNRSLSLSSSSSSNMPNPLSPRYDSLKYSRYHE